MINIVMSRDHNQIMRMMLIRAFENVLLTYSPRGFIHTSLGQEHSSAAAAMWAVSQKCGTMFFTGHRPHGCALAMGMSPESLLKEILRKPDSNSGGKGCSMNFMANLGFYYDDSNEGVPATLVTSAKVGGAVGMALGASLLKPTVAVVGDGAAETGVFYESINWMDDPEWTSRISYPLKVIVEGNGLAISHSVSGFRVMFDKTFAFLPTDGGIVGLPDHAVRQFQMLLNMDNVNILDLDEITEYLTTSLSSQVIWIETMRPYGHYYWERRKYPGRNTWNRNEVPGATCIPEFLFIGSEGQLEAIEKYRSMLPKFLSELFKKYLGDPPKENLLSLDINKEGPDA